MARTPAPTAAGAAHRGSDRSDVDGIPAIISAAGAEVEAAGRRRQQDPSEREDAGDHESHDGPGPGVAGRRLRARYITLTELAVHLSGHDHRHHAGDDTEASAEQADHE